VRICAGGDQQRSSLSRPDDRNLTKNTLLSNSPPFHSHFGNPPQFLSLLTTDPAAERRNNAAHGASRGTEPENNPATKERKTPERDLRERDLQEKEIERVQAAIEGAERGNWRDLRTVFEFAGIAEPNKEAQR
jgi:hypothetical protein